MFVYPRPLQDIMRNACQCHISCYEASPHSPLGPSSSEPDSPLSGYARITLFSPQSLEADRSKTNARAERALCQAGLGITVCGTLFGMTNTLRQARRCSEVSRRLGGGDSPVLARDGRLERTRCPFFREGGEAKRLGAQWVARK